MIVHGKVSRNFSSAVGMVSSTKDPIFHVANAVVAIQSGGVPVRIANTSNGPIELRDSQQVAQIFPLGESRNLSSAEQAMCGAVSSGPLQEQIKAAIDPALNPADNQHLGTILESFSDVFDNGLGHTDVVTHKIHREHRSHQTTPAGVTVRPQERRAAAGTGNVRPGCHTTKHQRMVQPNCSRQKENGGAEVLHRLPEIKSGNS